MIFVARGKTTGATGCQLTLVALQLYFLSAWYKKDELAKRIGGVFMFQALGQALGGFIAAACLTLEGKHGIAGWRWLFIVEGVVTVGFGAIFALIMPEFPHNARLLRPDQRDLAVWRLENERGSTEAHEEATAWDGLKAAVSDKKLWLLVWCGGMGQAMGSVFNFFPSIIASLGYGKYESLLLTVPPYIVAMIGYYICSFLSDVSIDRSLFPTLPQRGTDVHPALQQDLHHYPCEPHGFDPGVHPWHARTQHRLSLLCHVLNASRFW